MDSLGDLDDPGVSSTTFVTIYPVKFEKVELTAGSRMKSWIGASTWWWYTAVTCRPWITG